MAEETKTEEQPAAPEFSEEKCQKLRADGLRDHLSGI
jgi:hypothetical protein